MAHIFYNEYLVTVINRPVIDIIEAKRKEGIRLILVSATLDVIAKEVSERLGPSAGGIRGIGDDSIEGVGIKGPQHLQRVTLEDAPFLIIAHAHASPSFSFDFRGAETAPFPHIR